MPTKEHIKWKLYELSDYFYDCSHSGCKPKNNCFSD